MTTCHHCLRRKACVTHLIPLTLRTERRRARLGRLVTPLQLCEACGAQRQQDQLDYLRGAPPTALVCDGLGLADQQVAHG